MINSTTQLIYKQYYTRLFSFINSKVRNTEDTKDILSEVFIKIHKNIDKLGSHEKLTSWIFTITRNTIVDFYRKDLKHKTTYSLTKSGFSKKKRYQTL